MSQIQGNAPQIPQAHVVGGPQLQQAGRAAQGHEQAAPAGLGQQHSVGKTIGRIFLAILSLGVSEIVFGIIRACKAEVAAPEAHLPANQARSSSKENIRQANIRTTNNLLAGDEALQAAMTQGKNKATAVLGKLAVLDDALFNAALQKAIKGCETEVNGAKLEELAESVARNMLAKSLTKELVNNEPLIINESADRKTIIEDKVMGFKSMESICSATLETELEPLVAATKKRIADDAASWEMQAECKRTLFATGLQTFSEITGLASGSFTLDTWQLEDKLNIMGGDIDQKAATPENPYARASKEDIMAGWQPRAERFFTERAHAYNSINNLDVPANIKEMWQQSCFGNSHIDPNTFIMSVQISQKLQANDTLNDLLDTRKSIKDKIDIIVAFSAQQSAATQAVVPQERLAKMGPDERSVITQTSYDAVFSARPELIALLRANPELMTDLNNAMEERIDESMGKADERNRAEVTANIGGNELLSLLSVLVNAPQ